MNYLKAGDGYVESWPECDPDVVQVLANATFHAHLWEKFYYPDMVSRGKNDPVMVLSGALRQAAIDLQYEGFLARALVAIDTAGRLPLPLKA